MIERAPGSDTRGLHGGWATFQRHTQLEPHHALAHVVAHYWAVSWDLRGQPPYRQLVVPYPNVHLSFLNALARVYGVARRHVVRLLEGQGQVFGVAFRPGGFRTFLDAPVATITDGVVPADAVFGPDVPRDEMAATSDAAEQRRIVERFLLARRPTPDPTAERAAGIVATIVDDPGITRVADLAEQVGLGMRGLQRLFAEHVGVGPKWVIRRYRLHEVTQRMAEGAAIDWARLAAELGYADQAHLSRDFTAIVGEPPTRYAQRY